MTSNKSFTLAVFLVLYFLAWLIALPLLLFLKGLRPVCRQRFGMGMPGGPFDLWIHASSVGEAKLAIKLLSELSADNFPRLIISTNTLQGMKTLKEKVRGRAELVFFPFDFPPAQALALARIKPRQVLLLETEIWPAFLFNCKRKSIPVTIGNARMSLKSFCRYYPLSGLLDQLRPDKILAVSGRDQERFSGIFNHSLPGRMSNIKFDIIKDMEPIPYVKNPLSSWFKPGHPLIVLGSIRQEEETYIKWLIKKISSDHPKTTIALFPRHMKRTGAWEKFLARNNLPWIKRSNLETGSSAPGVILWDTFGDLLPAYALAKSAFVGGSLAPCGGQNFLEALSQGVVPCVGPFWDNFHWGGKELLSSNLLCQAENKHELYAKLIKPAPASRAKVLSNFRKYLSGRTGGTSMLIKNLGG